MRTRLLILDMHPIIYRSYFAKGIRDLKTSTGMFSGAFYGALKTLLVLRKRFPQAYMLCAFDGGASGRHEIYPEYKPLSDRTAEVQSSIDHMRAFCRYVGIPTLYKDDIEADDLIAISAVMWIQSHEQYHSMIVSSDTDFFQLVKTNLTVYDDRAKKYYGPQEVLAKTGVSPLHFLAYKCLKGDTADHIPGIPGFGPVKAAKYAPLGNAGVPEVSKDDFERNRKLMRLPTDFKHMDRILSDLQQRQYTREIENIYRGWKTDEGRHLQLQQAQKLLNYYEIKTLKPEDFL